MNSEFTPSTEFVERMRARVAAAEAAKAANATTQVHVTQPPSVYATFTPPQPKYHLPPVQPAKTDVPVREMFNKVQSEPWPVITPGPPQSIPLTSSDVINLIRVHTEQLHIRICELEQQKQEKDREIVGLKHATGTLEVQVREQNQKIDAMTRAINEHHRANQQTVVLSTVASDPVTHAEFDPLVSKFDSLVRQFEDMSDANDGVSARTGVLSHLLQKFSSEIHTSLRENKQDVTKSDANKSERPKRDDSKTRDSKQRDTSKSSADTMVPCPTCSGLKWPTQKVCKPCKDKATQH
jgi:hypothetical protein